VVSGLCCSGVCFQTASLAQISQERDSVAGLRPPVFRPFSIQSLPRLDHSLNRHLTAGVLMGFSEPSQLTGEHANASTSLRPSTTPRATERWNEATKYFSSKNKTLFPAFVKCSDQERKPTCRAASCCTSPSPTASLSSSVRRQGAQMPQTRGQARKTHPRVPELFDDERYGACWLSAGGNLGAVGFAVLALAVRLSGRLRPSTKRTCGSFP
jgi:hypothetical protein